MKLIILILTLVLLSQQISLHHEPSSTFYHSTDDWKQENDNTFYVDVDYSYLGLKNPPFVRTYLSCWSQCHTVSGVNSIYNLTNKGFRVKVQKYTYDKYPFENLKKRHWVLYWKIETLDGL